MDFLDPKKRKAHRIKLFIGYGLMAIALAFATVVVLYQAYGYDYDPASGEIVQNGLVFIDASPVEAAIKLNGENRGQTDTRIDTPSGEYSLELQADGYRTWAHDFTLEGGSIERLTYPFLFPTQLETTDMQLYATAPAFLSQSPDRKWLLAAQPGSFQSFDLVDTSVEAPTAITVSLPSGVLRTPGSTHKVSVVEWSTDNRHVLLKHEYEGGHEFAILDTESPGSSINLTRTVSGTYTTVMLRDKKYDQYYLYNAADKSLKTASLSARTPVVYLNNVLAFQGHGNDVMVFVTPDDAETGNVMLKIREGDETFNMRETKAGDKYLVDIARFENNWYVAAGSVQDQKVYIFKNPVAAAKRDTKRRPVPVAVLRSAGLPEFISFSSNARFVATQNGKEFSVYDAETDRQYRYDTGLQLDAGNEALWMDGHRFSVVSQEKVYVFDFDGTNKQELSSALNNLPVYFNQGWESLMGLAPSKSVTGRLAITSTSLRVETP